MRVRMVSYTAKAGISQEVVKTDAALAWIDGACRCSYVAPSTILLEDDLRINVIERGGVQLRLSTANTNRNYTRAVHLISTILRMPGRDSGVASRDDDHRK